MVSLAVPFWENTDDDLHCVQACFGMMLAYYFPRDRLSWDELEEITGFVPGYWTWTAKGFIHLMDRGLPVTYISTFDNEKFASREGRAYLIEVMGKEAGGESLKHTADFSAEQRFALEFATRATTESRTPDRADIRESLDNGKVVSCIINARSLGGNQGYAGHMVVVVGYTADTLIVHDPGLPPRKAYAVPYPAFEKAWNDTGQETKELFAVSKY